MNAIAKRLTHATMFAAVLAAAFTMKASNSAEAAVRVVQLPTVVVTAKRILVVQLAPVVITAKRLAPPATQVAQRNSRAAPV